MKIIDLLNKIANGEEVPKKIKLFGGVSFEYNIEKATYLSYYDKFNLLDMNNHLLRNKSINLLNEEVEIIEVPKKIPKKLKCKYTSQIGKIELAKTINEIIDYLESKGE